MAMLDVPDNRRHLPPSLWTDDRVELLKSLWKAGQSASQICTELGGFEHCEDGGRSAVCGKIHRLGMSNRDRPAKRKNDGGTTIRRINGRSGNTDRAATQRMARKLRVRSPSHGGVMEVNTIVRDEPPAPANFLCVALIDLDRHHCRFPRGGEDGEAITFCGQRKMDGESYCLAHHRIAYNAPKPIAPRPYLPLGGSKPRVI